MSFLVNYKLNQLFKKDAPRQTYALDDLHLIIFSDQHKGGGDNADDFWACRQSYADALQYYLVHETSYSLMVLGDAEELWENSLDEILKTHSTVFELEGKFAQEGRYTRFVGNHDNDWYNQGNFKKQLGKYLPDIKVLQGLRIQVTDGDEQLGGFFLVHGHQGSIFSDILWPISRLVVRYIHRPLQALFKYKTTTPSTNVKLRSRHDIEMYNWAVHHENVVLIAGHTHKVVFTGIAEEVAPATTPDSPVYFAEDPAEAKMRVEIHQEMDQPCYFNSGCCAYPDGEFTGMITGIEITNGEIRLIMWHREDGMTQRKVLQSADLRSVFTRVRNPGARIPKQKLAEAQEEATDSSGADD